MWHKLDIGPAAFVVKATRDLAMRYLDLASFWTRLVWAIVAEILNRKRSTDITSSSSSGRMADEILSVFPCCARMSDVQSLMDMMVVGSVTPVSCKSQVIADVLRVSGRPRSVVIAFVMVDDRVVRSTSVRLVAERP